jgi:hypothetical protein
MSSTEIAEEAGVEGLTALELARVVSLAEAARLAGISEDTIKRNHRDKILQLSQRRLGMRIRDALNLRHEG